MKHVFASRRGPVARTASLLVLFALLVGMLPTTSFAAQINEGDRVVTTDASTPETPTVSIKGIGTPNTTIAGAPWATSDVTPVIEATLTAPGSIDDISYRCYTGAAPAMTSAGAVESTTLPTITTDGTYTIDFHATQAGAQCATATAYVKLDKTNPTTPTAPAATGSIANTATITFQATDLTSGVKSILVTGTVPGDPSSISTTLTSGGSLVFTKAGEYNLHAVSTDQAGNSSPKANFTFTVIDITAPTTTLTGNASWLATATPLALAAVDNTGGVGVANIFYSVDNTSTAASAFTTYTAGIAISAEGTHTVRYFAKDFVGNTEVTKEATVRIDKSAPVSTISGVTGNWTSTDTTVSIVAADALSGVASVWSKLDTSPTVSSVPTRTVAITTEGVHTIAYGAVDNVGNREATRTAFVYIDKTKPVSSVDASANYSGSATISITATDALSGVATTAWKIDSGAVTSGTVAVYSIPGTHTIEYASTDKAGNVEITKSATFHITGGVVFSGLPAGGTPKYGASATISGVLVNSVSTTPTANQTVSLERSSASGTGFVPVATATTDASGAFSFTASLIGKGKTYFRVVLPTSADYAGATSAVMAFTPKVSVAKPSTKSRLRAGRYLAFSSTIRPDHASSKKSSTIAFEIYKKKGGDHVSRTRYYAKVSDKGSYSKLTRSIKFKRGTWYIRIYAKADSKHALTYSSEKKLVIK